MRSGADPREHREYVTALIQRRGRRNGGRTDLHKLAVDDRITAVGRWIRPAGASTSCPQLFNVIERPHVAGRATTGNSLRGRRVPELVPERASTVKPGLTGLWQVSGRNERTYEEMVRLDIEYAERRSLLLDLSILARTPFHGLSAKGCSVNPGGDDRDDGRRLRLLGPKHRSQPQRAAGVPPRRALRA